MVRMQNVDSRENKLVSPKIKIELLCSDSISRWIQQNEK